MAYRNLNSSWIRRILNFIIPLIGLLLIVLVLSLIWFWETAGRDHFLYEQRLALTQDTERGTVIDASMLAYYSFEKKIIFDEALKDPSEVVGLEAASFIPKGTLLHQRYFEPTAVELLEDQYVVRLPADWIYSMPNTLRRKDSISLYVIGRQEGSSEILFKTEVAYVKDSMNREIVDASRRDRLDGTGVISEISLVLTLDQLQQLEGVIRENNKVIIMYSEGAA